MSKGNPLFVDSTKFQGDHIGTRVELSGILLYEKESVWIKILDSENTTQVCPLELTKPGQYEGQVWLSHQQEVTFYFYIELEGQLVFRSPIKRSRASYLILEMWDYEGLDHTELSLPKKEDKVNKNIFVEEEALGSLIDKWGL